jgi:quercetin dioxygenase-like cupin family protein
VPVVPRAAVAFSQLPGRDSGDPLAGLDTGGCSVRIVRVGSGPRTPHRHPYSVEVMHVVAGTGEHWQGDASTQVGPGDVVLVPVGVPHVTVATGDAELELVCFFPHSDLAANTEELPAPVRG